MPRNKGIIRISSLPVEAQHTVCCAFIVWQLFEGFVQVSYKRFVGLVQLYIGIKFFIDGIGSHSAFIRTDCPFFLWADCIRLAFRPQGGILRHLRL